MGLGAFGWRSFEVNLDRIYTFDGLSVGESLNIEQQETDGGKPATYIKGLKEMTISFDITLNSAYCNVIEEINWWFEKLRGRVPEYLTLGNKTYGAGKCLLTSVSVADTTIATNGEYIKAKLTLGFTDWTTAGYKKKTDESASGDGTMSGDTVVEKAVSWAVSIADDNSHGYDQGSRWGVDYDCSALVITAYEKAGAGVKSAGATTTANMYGVFKRCGFSDITASVNLHTGSGLQRGDVLLKPAPKGHTVMVVDSGTIVHASINEKGTATGGKKGDQTGKEICTRSYYNKPWTYVLRYTK